MTPEKRKELLMYEANNPNSTYTSNGGLYKFSIAKVLHDPNRDWEIYHEPRPDVVQWSVEYEQGNGYYSTLESAKEAISPNSIGHIKRVICGETGKIKSIEVVK